jgi:Zn-dependent protease with chaperone function
VTLSARYFDGRTSRGEEVRLAFGDDGRVILVGETLRRDYALQDLDVAPRVGNTIRSVGLPDGGKCEIRDNDALDKALRGRRESGFQDWVHRLESRWRYVLAAAALTGAVSWALLVLGVPWLADKAAHALPTAVVRSLGEGTLEVLDQVALAPTGLDSSTRDRLQARFDAMQRIVRPGGDLRLVFRRGQLIGPNALALPSGVIVVTDELVKLARDDEELTAVLAHEIGHLAHRHSMRMVMQNSAVALIIAAIAGDPFSSSTLAAALPAMVIQARYSQSFETEADDFAYQYLIANGVPTHRFADILTRMAAGDGADGIERYLSTHPPTQERIARFIAPSRR